MRVLQINVNCKKGSTGKIAYDLYSGLIADGHEAAICYGRGAIIDEPNIFKFGVDIETYVHALLTRITGFTGCFSYFSTRKLMKYIKQYKPDIVHIHELHGYFVNITPIISYLKYNNIKTVWTFHCEFMYTGRCGYAYDCERWKSGCGHCPNVNEYPASVFLDFSKSMLQRKKDLFNGFNNLTIVTPSMWLADKIKQSFLKDKNIEVVRNGIETTDIFYPQEYMSLKTKYNLKDEKIILAVAPDIMQKRKGGNWIVELAKTLQCENIKIMMVGVDDLSKQFPKNIIPIARTSNQQELAKYYTMADVFVICSVMENFPTVCLEALCCGTPVCGFDTGGTAETAPMELGTFVAYGDIIALRSEILRILDGGSMGQQCVEYGKREYAKEVMYDNYRQIYCSKDGSVADNRRNKF